MATKDYTSFFLSSPPRVLHFIIGFLEAKFYPWTGVPTPALGQVKGVPFQLMWVQEWSGALPDLPEVTGMRTPIFISGFLVRAKCVDPDTVPGKWCGHF